MWLKWLDGPAKYVRVFSFDFSNAFDMVSHNIVCSKLKELPVGVIDFLTIDHRGLWLIMMDRLPRPFLTLGEYPRGRSLGLLC